MSSAFLDGTLPWSQLRLLTRVARPGDEKEWIRKADGLGLREIEALVGSATRQAQDAGAGHDDEEQSMAWSVRVSREGRRLWRAAVELAQRSAGEPLSAARVLELVAAEAAGSQDAHRSRSVHEPAADAAVLARLRALLASICADGAESACVEELSANASGSASTCPSGIGPTCGGTGPAHDERSKSGQPLYDGSPEDIAIRDPELAAFLAECARENAECARANAEATREIADAAREDSESSGPEAAKDATGDVVADVRTRLQQLRSTVAQATGFGWFARSPGSEAWEPLPFDAFERCDPRELDARLHEVGTAIQRLDGELAELLSEAADWRLYQQLGSANFEDYARSRLGICPSTAWSLVALERETKRSCPLLGAAWKEGRVTTLAARALLPVVGVRHGKAWIERAKSVTLRRLKAEVDWTLERRDAGLCGDDSPPPEEDRDVSGILLTTLTTDQLQMRSQEVKEATPPGAVEIRVFLPISVAVLVEETLVALRQGAEPRGRVFERMLALAMLEWLSVPRHPDPVFERDGWRCAVPACSSRRNLHDHHVVFRSHGGSNARDNRATVCAAHHLHGLHSGRIRATGTAPNDILWEMPFGRLRSDRYLRTDRTNAR